MGDIFVWQPEFNNILEQIASTDIVETEWSRLRNIIKYKVEKNIELFLAEAKATQSESPTQRTFSPEPSTAGGLKLAPFPPRTAEALQKALPTPKAHLSEEEANEVKGFIFEQLDSFEDGPPFTIQRISELCLNRRQHYAALGKYLRAVEKALLVTSNWAPAPARDASMVGLGSAALSFTPASDRAQSAPATPLFSPIPFLHTDARRSTSRSPPPLTLKPGSAEAQTGSAPILVQAELQGAIEPAGLGLVDELDDPGPGHMSDAPTALSAVTTLPAEDGASGTAPAEKAGTEDTKAVGGKPLFAALQDRFVAGGKEEPVVAAASDAMELDVDNSKQKQS